ncbi:MAG TPA: hypothetical protein VK631_23920 [Solirubrobacteraceae bacterium]|nr:hypothetical protein [Solirubrobacteraceae bacterium]
MTFIRNRRVVTTIVAAACMAVPASAAANALPPTYKSDAAQSGSAGSPPSTDRSDAAQSGIGALSESASKSTFPPADFRGGDTPADHPGASRAATAAPTTIEVVRPERTIVRDVDQALPLILSSTALLLVLAGAAITLVRLRMVPGPGRTH